MRGTLKTLGIIVIMLVGQTLKAQDRDASVTVRPGSYKAVSWISIDNDQAWTLILEVTARGGKFKLGTASAASAGTESWTVHETTSLITFTGTVPKNHALGLYKPKFSGEFEKDKHEEGGEDAEADLTWRVQGRMTVRDCAHAVAQADPDGFAGGKHGVEEKDNGIAHYEINAPVTNTATTQDLSNGLHDPPGSFSYHSIGLKAKSSEIRYQQNVECPVCKTKTWHTARFKYATGGDYKHTTNMPKWKQEGDGGPNAKAEWNKFYDALLVHENGHKKIFKDDYITPALALMTTFSKTVLWGKAHSRKEAKKLAVRLGNTSLATLSTNMRTLWTTMDGKQTNYDNVTNHGITQNAHPDYRTATNTVMRVDILLKN